MLLAYTEKAPLSGAFLFFCTLLFALPAFSRDCSALLLPPNSPAEKVRVSYIFDGDTVKLDDGRRIRLLGINTPEMGPDGHADEPFAVAARQALLRLTERSELLLVVGAKPEDHYGRVLGHLLRADGSLLSAELLRQGLGYWISVSPNIRAAGCLAAAEQVARQSGLGVWRGDAVRQARQLQPGDQGFMLLEGRVTGIQTSRKAHWLTLDNRLVVQMSKALATQLKPLAVSALRDRHIAVRGWVIDRQARGQRLKKGYQRWLLRLTAASMLQLVTDR